MKLHEIHCSSLSIELLHNRHEKKLDSITKVGTYYVANCNPYATVFFHWTHYNGIILHFFYIFNVVYKPSHTYPYIIQR